jgi:hypothetical protein
LVIALFVLFFFWPWYCLFFSSFGHWIVCSFLLLVIALSVLRFTASDYPLVSSNFFTCSNEPFESRRFSKCQSVKQPLPVTTEDLINISASLALTLVR